MITDDAIRLIQQTAIKAHGSRIHKAEAEPKHVYYVEQPDGALRTVEATPEPAAFTAGDFDSLARIVVDQGNGECASIWCSTVGIVGLFDDTDRRDRVTLKLTPSFQFVELSRWNGAGIAGVAFDHVQTYTLFRSLFRDALPAHSSIRDDIRKVDIQKAQQAAGEVSRTAVSMSKRLIAEASGADRLPEVLTFDVPVFAEAVAPIRAQIRVAFDLDPQQEKFRFIVLPNEIEAAIATAEEWLMRQVRAVLGETKINVFCGRP